MNAKEYPRTEALLELIEGFLDGWCAIAPIALAFLMLALIARWFGV